MDIPFHPALNGLTILNIYGLTPQDATPTKCLYSPDGINHLWKDYPIPETKCSLSLPTEENTQYTYEAPHFYTILRYWHWDIRLLYDENSHHGGFNGYNIEIRGPKVYLQKKEGSLREVLDFLQKQRPSFEKKQGWKTFNPIVQKLIEGLRPYA